MAYLMSVNISEKKIVKIVNTDSPLTCLSFMEDGVTLASGTTQGKVS